MRSLNELYAYKKVYETAGGLEQKRNGASGQTTESGLNEYHISLLCAISLHIKIFWVEMTGNYCLTSVGLFGDSSGKFVVFEREQRLTK